MLRFVGDLFLSAFFYFIPSHELYLSLLNKQYCIHFPSLSHKFLHFTYMYHSAALQLFSSSVVFDPSEASWQPLSTTGSPDIQSQEATQE